MIRQGFLDCRGFLGCCAALLLSGCLTLPKPKATPAPKLVVCAPEAMKPCTILRYVLPDGEIPADAAAAIAIASRKSECECATRQAALLNCVSAHNGAGRESPAPCPEPRK